MPSGPMLATFFGPRPPKRRPRRPKIHSRNAIRIHPRHEDNFKTAKDGPRRPQDWFLIDVYLFFMIFDWFLDHFGNDFSRDFGRFLKISWRRFVAANPASSTVFSKNACLKRSTLLNRFQRSLLKYEGPAVIAAGVGNIFEIFETFETFEPDPSEPWASWKRWNRWNR